MLLKRVIGIVTRIGKDITLGIKGEGVEATPVAVPVAAASGDAKPPVSSEKKKE